ncbi:MAG: hypothetical protein IKN50_01900, partial [Clostridia bacterium]|nr:hypothetical protein [Clostridia bacterium]
MTEFDIKTLLDENSAVDAYRITEKRVESHELFFGRGKLETVRSTDTQDTEVAVFSDHDGKRGDSSFSVFRGMSEVEAKAKIESAVSRAKLVFNEPYELPAGGDFSGEIENDLSGLGLKECAEKIADTILSAEQCDGCSINALEVFVYRDTVRVRNSEGVDKTQRITRADVESIPTYTDANGSYEIYHRMHFTDLDTDRLKREVSRKSHEVKDRANAKKAEPSENVTIVLRIDEISSMIDELTYGLNYADVYTESNRWGLGDDVQTQGECDPLTVTMKAAVKGSDLSAFFDKDGTDLSDVTVIENGKVTALWGSSRFGQYLKVGKPSGSLLCYSLKPGTLTDAEIKNTDHLECASLSGLQIDP